MNLCKSVCLSVVASAACAAGTVPSYRVIDLGTLGGNAARAWEVNAGGQVVGESTNGAGQSRGFFWNGSMGTLATPATPLISAYSVNDQGVVAGVTSTGMVVGSGGQWASIGSLGSGGGVPRAINNAGLVTGVSVNSAGRARAFRWDGQTHALATLGGDRSEGYGINETADVAGWAEDASATMRACVWSGTGSVLNVGASFPAGSSAAYAINDGGVVVGEARNAQGQFRAFIWRGAGNTTSLGTLGGDYSVLTDINNNGLAVGTSKNSAGNNRAMIYMPDRGMADLNLLASDNAGLTLLEAWSISDTGYIAGYARNSLGQDRAFLAQLIPSPGTMPLLVISGLCTVRRRRF